MALLPTQPTKRMMMNDAVSTLFDKTTNPLVGRPINRVDGPLKVSGQAPYAAEFHRDNQAYGVMVGATIAKGRVTKIDSSALEDIPDIIKVVTDSKHFLRNAQQGGKTKAPTQGATDIVYHGQPIAVVIGETLEAATEGAKALKITYEDKMDAAALDFSSELDNAHAVNEKEGSDKNAQQGDPEQGLANAKVVLDQMYYTPSQSNSPMEPHATLAHWEDDKLVLHTSNQMLAFCKQQIADALDMKSDNVQLIAKYVGGGFGSKLGIAPETIAAAIAAQELKRPVLIVMTRPQVMETTVRRSNTQQRIAIGCDESGLIDTFIHDSISSNLPDEAFFEPTALSTHYLYRGENRRVNYKMVDMNWVLAGSMRAPGEAVGLIAVECAMDELAEKLSLDPIELRRRNEPKEDPSQKIPFSTRTLITCMEQGAKAFGWEERIAKPATNLQGDWWIGTGMAAVSRGNQLMPSEARATLQLDSTKTHGVIAIIESDMTDIGTGSYTVFSQVAADLLGLPIDHIDMRLGDSELPSASGSGGSFGAASAGSAIYLACAQLRELLAQKVGLYADNVQLQAGQVCQAGEHDPSLSQAVTETIAEAGKDVAVNIADTVVDTVSRLAQKVDTLVQKTGLSDSDIVSMGTDAIAEKAANKVANLVADKVATLKPLDYDFSNFKAYPLSDIISQYADNKLVAIGQIAPGKNKKSHRQASYGANFAEVAVHRTTGEIRVQRMTGAFAAGRILNHKTATSQCYGGMVFGIGSALMEEVIHDKHDGRLCNHDLAEYHLPVNADVPQLDVILVEEDDPYTNPMHIKGIGETAISGAAAAIANAIYNAVGVRVYDFPITLDKLLPHLPD